MRSQIFWARDVSDCSPGVKEDTGSDEVKPNQLFTRMDDLIPNPILLPLISLEQGTGGGGKKKAKNFSGGLRGGFGMSYQCR
jgi:hypothetical protein